ERELPLRGLTTRDPVGGTRVARSAQASRVADFDPERERSGLGRRPGQLPVESEVQAWHSPAPRPDEVVRHAPAVTRDLERVRRTTLRTRQRRGKRDTRRRRGGGGEKRRNRRERGNKNKKVDSSLHRFEPKVRSVVAERSTAGR